MKIAEMSMAKTLREKLKDNRAGRKMLTRADEGCEQRDEGVATTEHSRISPPAR